jgi:hypothetical protein
MPLEVSIHGTVHCTSEIENMYYCTPKIGLHGTVRLESKHVSVHHINIHVHIYQNTSEVSFSWNRAFQKLVSN